MFNLPDPTPLQLSHDSWRIFRILSEFVEGFEKLTSIGPSVTIFGSARLNPSDPYYQLATATAQAIAARGLAIITGGGPGVMEAANRGAQLAGQPSCGLCIDLPFESDPNPYVDRQWRMHFRYFFVRKVLFVRYAKAFVVLPGGLGTLDELFEALTLIQTHKTQPFPVILIGSAYWKGLLEWLEQVVLQHGCIERLDLERLTLSDDPEEVAELIEAHCKNAPLHTNF